MKDWREDDRKGENGVKTVALERNKRKGVGCRGKERTGDETEKRGERGVSGGRKREGGREK